MRLFNILCLLFCLFSIGGAYFGECPTLKDWENCVKRYDENKDDRLNLDEFKTLWGNLPLLTRMWAVGPTHDFEACDHDKDELVSAKDMEREDCMGSCVAQFSVYRKVCDSRRR